MNQEIKDFLNTYSVENGWGIIEDGKFISHLLKEEKVISEEYGYKSRWYTEVSKVVKIKDRYFLFGDYHITGDGSASDMGLEFDDATIVEVAPVEVKVTKYLPIKGEE